MNSNCNRQNMPSVRWEMRLKKLLSFEHQGQPIVKVEYRYWRDADCKFPVLRYLDDGCQSAAEIMGNVSVKILIGRRRCWEITEQTQQKCYAFRRVFNFSVWGIKTVHFSQQFLQQMKLFWYSEIIYKLNVPWTCEFSNNVTHRSSTNSNKLRTLCILSLVRNVMASRNGGKLVVNRLNINLGFVSPCTIIHSNKSTNHMYQSLRFIVLRSNTAQHVSGILLPIIRNL
jgi:hypothetical protein